MAGRLTTYEKANQPRRVLSNDNLKIEVYKKHVSIFNLQNGQFVCAIDVRTVRRMVNALDGVDDVTTD